MDDAKAKEVSDEIETDAEDVERAVRHLRAGNYPLSTIARELQETADSLRKQVRILRGEDPEDDEEDEEEDEENGGG
jgi:hypothetical protein